ncbi:hypothetical protein [Vibrio furnissii]|uniref:hypothetical protein n=1 Tax=Vibrio furnissii TaxID=29494 RepID=UPI000200DBA0|nr:hypothetical protein [Vibrio furnissii]ADT87661.1 hypothetical protein vfu_A02536 [Vibrio furnissii NCTC 11218]
MSLDNIRLAKSVCKRIPYKVLEILLKECGIRTKRGIIAVEETLTDLAISSDPKDVQKLDQLKLFYHSYLMYGDKTVSLAQLHEDNLKSIDENYENLLAQISDIEIHYPFLDDTTDNLLSDEPILIDLSRTEDGILFTYASLKSLVEKIELDEAYLNQINFTAPAELYDITAKRCVQRRYYDSAFLRFEDSTVEFRLDTSSISSKDSLLQSLGQLRNAFVNTVTEVIPGSSLQLDTLNLFYAVPGGYQFSQLRVCELGFSVGSVIHHEKMRTSTKDLRKELFHQGGKNSLAASKHKIQVFRIALRKQKSITDIGHFETELYLPGASRMLQSTPPFLEYAIISNCISAGDYNNHIAELKSNITQYKKFALTTK